MRVSDVFDLPESAEPSGDELLWERLLAYGFSVEEIERCFAEVEAYARQGRRS